MREIRILMHITAVLADFCPESCTSCGTSSTDGKVDAGLYICSGERLMEVPYGFPPDKIRDLRLNSNEILKIHQHDFRGWSRMETLHLENNNITELEPNSFKTLLNLTVLYLSNNKMVSVHEGVFEQMKSLRQLHMDHNLLETVPQDFSRMKQLKILTLTNNRIKSIDWWHFRRISLERLMLANNPMNCTCNNFELRNWVDVKMKARAANGRSNVDLHFICRSEIAPTNCTEPKIYRISHERDMSEVYSEAYRNLYTTGQNVSLFCNFTGDPYPRVSWSSARNNEMELTDLDPRVTSDGHLTLYNVTRAQTGAYFCNLETISYRAEEAKVTVSVIDGVKPNITQITPETKLIEGDVAQLSCNITSDPPSIITWHYPNGTIVDDTYNTDKLKIIKMKSGSFLTIRDLYSADQGKYRCKGRNFLGTVEGEILLIVEVAEPEGDSYLIIIGGVLVALVLIAIFIVAGSYAKRYRRQTEIQREREREVERTQPADGMRI